MNSEKEIKQMSLPEIPNKMWISLMEACELKGLNYKTSCNKVYLQPNGGISEARIGGNRKFFARQTVIEWLMKSDEELMEDRHV